MPPSQAPPNQLAPLDLTPAPVDLNNDNPSTTFTVQNDVPGVAYTAAAAPGCVGTDGGIYVAGDSQPQTAVAGTPTMFLAYAIGTPPATCKIAVLDASGNIGEIDATYETLVVQSHRRSSLAVVRNVTPASVTITKANQIVPLAITSFSGTTTASAGTCAKGASGISVSPATLASGAGTFVIAPFGTGAVSKACTVTISDTAGNHSAIPVTLAIGALAKFTVTPSTVQFACAASTAPTHCRTLQTVTFNESGATSFQIAPRAFPAKTCADKFEGPLKMAVGTAAPSLSVAGPSATLAFDGLLPGATLACTRIPVTDGGSPPQVVTITVNPTLAVAPPPAIATAAAPPCVGNDPFVAVPSAPHGMFVWVPTPNATRLMQKYVIGKDPTLCGASIVISWADVEKSKGVFDFSSVEAAAQPYTSATAPPYSSAGLTVNLLFADATEGTTNTVTPPWVLAEVPTYSCNGGAQMPAYWNATYEADWVDLISHAIAYFSNTSRIKNNVGYMRFATGGGAEALAPPGYADGGTCQAAWANLGYSYNVWVNHTINIVTAMGSAPTTHQIVASLPEVQGGTTVYDVPNAFAAVAVSKHVGLAFESLGTSNVAAPNATPSTCNPQAKITNLHWCQAFIRYAGVVPLAMQPITATTTTTSANIDIAKLLPYALDNNIQIFELYPDEWLVAAGVPAPDPVDAATQAKYKAALRSASVVLGAAYGQ